MQKPYEHEPSLRTKPGQKEINPNVVAMFESVKTGWQIQKDFPDIAEDYRAGFLISEIAKGHDIAKHYTISPKTAEMAVLKALKGHTGKNGIEGFVGLLSPEEYYAIASKNLFKSRQDIGSRAWKEGKGMFGLTTEQRQATGRASGTQARENQTGIHAQTGAQRRAFGQMGAAKQGKEIYSDEERALIASLIGDRNFRKNGGKLDIIKITAFFNERFRQGKEPKTAQEIKNLINKKRLQKSMRS